MISEYLALFPDMALQPFLIGLVIGALISAHFGFRLFKFSIVVSFASAGFLLGTTVVGLMFPDGIAGLNFDVGFIVGIALAVILALISVKIYKALIYIVGGAFGVLLGFVIPYFLLLAFDQELAAIIVGAIVAVVLAVICAKGFMKIMKPLVIIETSLGGMALAFEGAAMLIGLSDAVVAIASVVGLVFGIFAAKYQFSINEGRELFGND